MRSHGICFSVRLTALSIMPSKFIHVVTNGKFHSFLWLNNTPSALLSTHFPLTKLHLLFYTYHDKAIIYFLTILSTGNVQKLNLLIMSCFFVCECISSLVTKHHGHICARSLAPPTILPPPPIFPACKPHHEEHLRARVSTSQGSESPRNQAPCASACWGTEGFLLKVNDLTQEPSKASLERKNILMYPLFTRNRSFVQLIGLCSTCFVAFQRHVRVWESILGASHCTFPPRES